MLKKVLSLLLVFILIVFSFAIISSARATVPSENKDKQEIAQTGLSSVKYGKTGEVSWRLELDGTLVVYGSGKMGNYEVEKAPWGEWKDDITKVLITDGVTSIGSNNFSFYYNLESVSISKTITYISEYAFRCCGSLKSVIIPNKVTVIGRYAFAQCSGMTSLVVGSGVEYIGDYAFFMCTSLESATIYTQKLDYSSYDCGALGYSYIGQKIEKFTLLGYAGTLVESYAKKEDFVFVPTSGEAPEISVPVPPEGPTALPTEPPTTAPTDSPTEPPTTEPTEPKKKSEIKANVSVWETYDEITDSWHYPVDNFDYALGSFAWDKHNYDPNANTNDNLIDRTNYDKLYLKLELNYIFRGVVIGFGQTDVVAELTAPDGFSFSANNMVTKYTCSAIEMSFFVTTKTFAVPIYPIFSMNYKDGQEIKVDAKVTSTKYGTNTYSVSIGKIHKRDQESKINIADTDEMLTVSLTPDMFSQSPDSYVHQLARFGIGLSSLEYCSNQQIEDSYRNLGFSNIRIYGETTGYANINNVNFSFASKRIIINKKIYTIIVAPIRGTIDTNEWLGNADAIITENGDHRSFRNAADNVRENLEWYLKYTDPQTAGKRKLFLTGHSRGAAAANLLGADIDNNQFQPYFTFENAYVYTFATPNTTKDDKISAEKFHNIFNIIDYNDLVATVPPRFMGYNKYGLTYSFALDSHIHSYLPSIINNVNDLYYLLTNRVYQPLSELDRITYMYNLTGSIFGIIRGAPAQKIRALLNSLADTSVLYQREKWTHSTSNYIAWMESLHNLNEMMFSEVNFKKIEVQCPVDVEIVDSKGKTVGKTNNGVVEDGTSNRDCVLLAVEDDHKIILLPDIDDYTIKTTGYAEGSMNITIVDYVDYKKDCVTCYYNEPVENSHYYTMQLFCDYSGCQLSSADGTLIAADKVYDKEQLDETEISVKISGNGKVVGDGAYTPGEIAVLTAIPGNVGFVGWFQDGKLISKDTEISFVVNESCLYEARFKNGDSDILLGDVDGDDEVTIIDVTCIQRKLASFPTAKLVEAAADADEDNEITIIDATTIQRWLAQLPSNDNIGKPIT